MTDSLGDRMKAYEAKTTTEQFMSGLPVIARMDGRAFHSFTRGLKRPYDERLTMLMADTTAYLVYKTGAITGYTQSDEISLLFYSTQPKQEIFFNGRVFKMVSQLAAMTTMYFNKKLPGYIPEKVGTDPLFDARVFQVPTEVEATNYFVWRENDATRNSISMAAQSMFSHNQLMNKNTSEMQQMMYQHYGVNWAKYPDFFKRGTYVQRKKVEKVYSPEEIAQLPMEHPAHASPELKFFRNEIFTLNIPPLTKMENRVDVIFGRYEDVPVYGTGKAVF